MALSFQIRIASQKRFCREKHSFYLSDDSWVRSNHFQSTRVDFTQIPRVKTGDQKWTSSMHRILHLLKIHLLHPLMKLIKCHLHVNYLSRWSVNTARRGPRAQQFRPSLL